MPANFTRFPKSDDRVFDVLRQRSKRRDAAVLSLQSLRSWGSLIVPGNLWRALSRFGPWIDPMLASEWTRLTRAYAERIGVLIAPGVVEAVLEWREPVRSTGIARWAAEKMFAAGVGLECIWTGRRLSPTRMDIDHCMPWSAWPCGDLWNLGPSKPKVNRHEKRDRLPSAAIFADSRDRIIGWWERAYLSDEALGARFLREVAASLPVIDGGGTGDIYSALDWRRLRLLRDQRGPQWTR